MGSFYLNFISSLLLLSLTVVEIRCENSLQFKSFEYQKHHNSCTRKLICLLSSQSNGTKYNDILQGLEYFYQGVQDKEPFKSEIEFIHFAWNAGRKNPGNGKICSNLNVTHSCKISSESLMEKFNDVYLGENYELEDLPKSRQTRQAVSMVKRLMKRVRKINFLGRPFLRPEGYAERRVCQLCEEKRSYCFNFYMGTYGLCGGAWLVAGVIGTASCNVLTIPRTLDCTVNAWFNCHQKNCGFVGF